MKIRTVVAGLFHADGRMGGWADRHDEANSLNSQFDERADKYLYHPPTCDFKFNQNCSNKNILFSICHSKIFDDSETYFASVFPNSELFSWVI